MEQRGDSPKPRLGSKCDARQGEQIRPAGDFTDQVGYSTNLAGGFG